MNLHRVAMGLFGAVSLFVVGCGGSPTGSASEELTSTVHEDAINSPPGTGLGSGGPGAGAGCSIISQGTGGPAGYDLPCASTIYYSLGNGHAEVSAICQNNSVLQGWMNSAGLQSPWDASYGASCATYAAPAGYTWISYDPTCPGCGKSTGGIGE